MSAVVTYRAESGLWSAAIPGVSIICHAITKDACAAAIAAAVEGVDVDAVMASPVGPLDWKQAFATSAVGCMADLRGDVDQLNDPILAQSLLTKLEWLEGILREVHTELSEANRLQTEANQQHERSLRVAEQQEHRIAEAKAAQAAADEAASWLDVSVTMAGNGEVVVTKHYREFHGWQGTFQTRNADIRETAKVLATYPSVEAAPAAVRARLNRPMVRSKFDVPPDPWKVRR
jgi:hypothetical protein